MRAPNYLSDIAFLLVTVSSRKICKSGKMKHKCKILTKVRQNIVSLHCYGECNVITDGGLRIHILTRFRPDRYHKQHQQRGGLKV